MYLDKADLQRNQEDWFRLAEYGMEAVIARWEQEVLIISGGDLDLESLKGDLKKNLSEIVETRLAEYLMNQFFRNLKAPEVGSLLQVIDEQNLIFLYQQDEEGNVLKDSQGAPLYMKSGGLFDVTQEDADGNIVIIQEGDKTKWSRAVKASMYDVLSAWEDSTFAAYSEILSGLAPDMREAFEKTYSISIDRQKMGLRRELDHLYLKEQNRLILSRLYDKNSLEYKTRQETASAVSQQLINDTQEKLNEGIDALMSGLNEQVGEVQTEGCVIDGDQWQESFRHLMEQGLADWDKAEEKLLMGRIEWEREIGDQMKAGENAWADAFRLVQDKRKEWFDKFKAALEEGNEIWAEENRELETAIGEAVAELEANIENRKVSLQNRVDNLIGMLLQSVNMMRTARSSWTYWMDKADSEDLGTF